MSSAYIRESENSFFSSIVLMEVVVSTHQCVDTITSKIPDAMIETQCDDMLFLVRIFACQIDACVRRTRSVSSIHPPRGDNEKCGDNVRGARAGDGI